MASIKHQKLVFTVIAIVFIMELFDASALNPILPKVAFDLHVNPVRLKLAVTAYIIMMALFTPVSGWMSDRLGLKTTMIFSLVGFIIFSTLSGLSTNVTQLIVFRCLQGTFAAFTAPVIRLAMVRMYDDLVEVMAKITLLSMLAPFAGSLVSGAFATWLSWRYVFFVNVPLGLFALCIILKYFPKYDDYQKQSKFDWIGFLTLGGAIAIFFYLSNIIYISTYTLPFKITLGIITLLLITLYLLTFKMIKMPIIDIRLLKDKLFKPNIILLCFSKLSIYWIFFTWPIYMYTILNYDAFMCSVMMTCTPIGVILSKFLGNRIIKKFSFKFVLFFSLLGLGILQICSGFIIYQYNYLLWITVMILIGFMLGTFQLANGALAYIVVPSKKLSSCNTITILSSQVGAAFSITFSALIYHFVEVKDFFGFTETLSPLAFSTPFFISALVLFALCYIAARLPKNIGNHIEPTSET